MRKSIIALFRILSRLDRDPRGITAIELAVIVVVLVGIGSLFAISDLVANIGGAGGSSSAAPRETIEDSFAALVLLGAWSVLRLPKATR